jgi:hypothetical protein
MQSSTAIALRALVMLIVLISVPLFAIFGKSLPDVVKGLLEGRSLVLSPTPGGEQNPPATTPATPANNPFAQTGPYRAARDANSAVGGPGGVGLATNPATLLNVSGSVAASPSGSNLSAGDTNSQFNPAANRLQPMPTGNTVAVVPSASVPTVADPSRLAATTNPQPAVESHAMPASSSGAQPASFLSAPDATAISPADSVRHDGNVSGLATNVPADSVYAGGKTNPMRDGAGQAATVTTDEKFRRAEIRLRELGATHYMLETWGADNNRYRFVCKMSVGGNAEVTRYFQAIDDNPWQAMQTVLEQVEDWRSRSQPQ